MDVLIKLLIVKTSFTYKKCKEFYSMNVSVLTIAGRNESGPIYRNVVQCSGSHSDEPEIDITKASETLLFKPSIFSI